MAMLIGQSGVLKSHKCPLDGTSHGSCVIGFVDISDKNDISNVTKNIRLSN